MSVGHGVRQAADRGALVGAPDVGPGDLLDGQAQAQGADHELRVPEPAGISDGIQHGIELGIFQ